MQKRYKLMTLLFVLVLSFSLIGCNSASESSKEKQESKEIKTTETANIKPKKTSNITKEITPIENGKKNTVSKSTHESNTTTAANVAVKKQTASKKPVAAVQKVTTTSTAKIKTTTKDNQIPLKAVTFSITGPKDHRSILSATKVSMKDGETILNVLLHAAKNAGIQVDYEGNGATAYVNGIDNIYEFDYGSKSGWLFKQNGVSLTKSVGLVKIKAGDRIECYYTE